MSETPSSAAHRDVHAKDVEISLRSDPPWLYLAIFLFTAACVAGGMLYFRSLHSPNVHPALGLLPALTVATFGSAALAWWGRKRGGALRLRVEPGRVVVQDRGSRELVVDRGVPFAAVLVTDKTAGRRALVLSQRGEPIVVLDTSRGAGSPSASAWRGRALSLDLSSVAISPASANVLTVTGVGEFDALLDQLANDFETDAPLVRQPLPSGHILVVQQDDIRTGAAEFPVGDTIARRTRVPTHSGNLDGLSLVRGTDAMLLASHGGAENVEVSDESSAPEALLSPIVFEIIASRFDGRSRGAEPTSSVSPG